MIRAVVETIHAGNTPMIRKPFDPSLHMCETGAATASSLAPTPTNHDAVFSIYHNRPIGMPIRDVASCALMVQVCRFQQRPAPKHLEAGEEVADHSAAVTY